MSNKVICGKCRESFHKHIVVVNEHVQKAVENMIKRGIKALVIACNTATSISITELRSMYSIPIIGMEPAAKPAVELSKLLDKKVLVFATDLTLKELKYKNLITKLDKSCVIDSLALPTLVEFCEKLNFEKEPLEFYFKKLLRGFDLNQYGTIVLGCTHFPYYKSILRDILPPHISLIDGSEGTVKRLESLLKENQLLNKNGTNHILFECSSQDQTYIVKMKEALSLLQNELNSIPK
jgi:glutamate racemase